MTEQQISIDDFNKVDIRLGKVIKADDFPEARKPAYKLTIDFGKEIGIKHSSAQITNTYKTHDLENMLVLCVVNLKPRQVGPFVSEVLTLGLASEMGYILVSPTSDSVNLGERLC